MKFVKRLNVTLLAAMGYMLPHVAYSQATVFSYSGAIVDYTVPTTGIYDITAFGAQGGSAAGGHNAGGMGAEISGDFSLTAGELLNIVVGGQGATSGYTGGGGGGSFVYTGSTPLVVAGGGGGAGNTFYLSYAGALGGPGQITTDGQAGFGTSGIPNNAGAGGTGGGGGGGGDDFNDGAGGGGWFGNGGNGRGPLGYSGDGGLGAFSFAGGSGGYAGDNGGFGGGGGGGYASGGGGGGYSGGGGGAFAAGFTDDGGGGGGGSYLDLSATDPILTGGENPGNGEVVITAVQLASVPDSGPGLAFVGSVFLGLCVFSCQTFRRRFAH